MLVTNAESNQVKAWRCFRVTAVVVTVVLMSCGTVDQTWHVRYLFHNQSSIDLLVEWGSRTFYSRSTALFVPVGATKQMEYYEEFLGPPPDAKRDFTCITVRRASDESIVFQLPQPRNDQWTSHLLNEYYA